VCVRSFAPSEIVLRIIAPKRARERLGRKRVFRI
jgi:hypothetical protein